MGSSGWIFPESLVEYLRHKVRKESQKLGRNQKVYLHKDPGSKTKFLPPSSQGRPKIQFQNARLIDKGAKQKLQSRQKILFCGIKDRIELYLAEIEVLKNIPHFASVEEARKNI